MDEELGFIRKGWRFSETFYHKATGHCAQATFKKRFTISTYSLVSAKGAERNLLDLIRMYERRLD
jgi:hypothetical protein